MNNKNTSDFIAATMASVLDSTDHQELFSGQYKTAAAKCKDCQKAMDKCMCSMADDKGHSKHSGKVCKDCHKAMDKCMCSMADDSDSDTNDLDMYDLEAGELEDPESYSEYDFPADDQEVEELSATAAFDVAIEGLLTASAALDAVDMNHSSELSLKLASLVVQAKKIKEEEKSVKSTKSTKSTKSKKPAPAKKKLTSKDFKKMLEEDDDGKLTAANFKKMRSASSKYTFNKFADENGIQSIMRQYVGADSSTLNYQLEKSNPGSDRHEAMKRLLAGEKPVEKSMSEDEGGSFVMEKAKDYVSDPFADADQAELEAARKRDEARRKAKGDFGTNNQYPPVSTKLQGLLGVKQDGQLGPETKNAIFKAKQKRQLPLSTSDKELENILDSETPFTRLYTNI